MRVLLTDPTWSAAGRASKRSLPLIWTYTDTVHLAAIAGTNLMLSGDNAMAVGMAVRNLPPRRQRLALSVGIGLAIVVQIVATLTVASMLGFPPLAFLAGVLLIPIAIRLKRRDRTQDQSRPDEQVGTLYRCIATVVFAYLLMSLDNILVVAAFARGYPLALCLGLLLSSGALVFASIFIAGLVRRYPLLLSAVAGFLGWRAGMMIGRSLWYSGVHIRHLTTILVPVFTTVLVLSSGFWWWDEIASDSIDNKHSVRF